MMPAFVAVLLLQSVQVQPALVTVRQLTYAQPDGSRNAATLVTPAAPGARTARDSLSSTGTSRRGRRRTAPSSSPRPSSSPAPASCRCSSTRRGRRRTGSPRATRRSDYEFTGADDDERAARARRAAGAARHRQDPRRRRRSRLRRDVGRARGRRRTRASRTLSTWPARASFTDWYLFTPKKEGAEKDAFVAKLAPLDPIAHSGEDLAAAGAAAVRQQGQVRQERGAQRPWPTRSPDPRRSRPTTSSTS